MSGESDEEFRKRLDELSGKSDEEIRKRLDELEEFTKKNLSENKHNKRISELAKLTNDAIRNTRESMDRNAAGGGGVPPPRTPEGSPPPSPPPEPAEKATRPTRPMRASDLVTHSALAGTGHHHLIRPRGPSYEKMSF
jgi:hypothetical protein